MHDDWTPHVTLVADLPLAERFAYFAEGLKKVLWAAGPKGLIAAPAWMLVFNRLNRMRVRFAALVARFLAGTLPAPRAARARPAAAARSEAPPPPPSVPRRFGWLMWRKPDVPPLREAVAGWRFHLEMMLEDAELKALLAAAPQAGRILRPLCHMLGIRPTAELRLPRRVRVRKKKEPLPPHPAAARFPDTPAARSAARGLARMQAGLPVDVTRLSSVAYGYFVHPPRDDNCPPPEIGYARARRWWPKDYKPPKDWD
jgi:hypothetical protein